jgi:hypothetical protein
VPGWLEAIPQKGGNSIAVSAIAWVALRQSFQVFGASRGRGTRDHRGAFCHDRLHIRHPPPPIRASDNAAARQFIRLRGSRKPSRRSCAGIPWPPQPPQPPHGLAIGALVLGRVTFPLAAGMPAGATMPAMASMLAVAAVAAVAAPGCTYRRSGRPTGHLLRNVSRE